ncbi:CitMHS family transporter [Steroidobacter sp.]|uniref:CitMHS family transporter n=1 Tax=Steroidobacter sp. TaxID=1978227 RepID=UPI001A5BFA9F|nr:CitMHS family transporter [Steroidobacter sp.]MBL8269343.1 CitMHS family transporter [Steroidobacter sp.]
MLTLLGFGMVITFMTLIMTKRASPLVALIAIPLIFALVAGFGSEALGKMMLDGIRLLAPTGVMLMFAILYFGIMIDAGLFDPVVKAILRSVGNDPMKVVVGTAVLAALVSLDGDGSTTYMITVASVLPLYKRLGLNPLNLTCVTILAGGVMNLTPWGGPLARAATALHVDPSEVFLPLIPVMAVGVGGVFLLAYFLGLRERQRLGKLVLAPAPLAPTVVFHQAHQPQPVVTASAVIIETDPAEVLKRPKLRWFNALLTVALLVGLITSILPLPVLFMLAFAIAIVVNYPQVAEQRARITAHAGNVLAVVSLIFAAGVFTGILSGTGMVEAMSGSLLHVVPKSWAPALATITALASMPFTFFISNDAFYYGVLPIVSEMASTAGITPVEMARASLIGQPVHLLSPLVPSTYLLVGLANVEFGDHQKFTIKWAVLVCLLMMVASLLFGLFPLMAR